MIEKNPPQEEFIFFHTYLKHVGARTAFSGGGKLCEGVVGGEEQRPTALVGGGGRGVQATWTTVQTPCSPKALQVVRVQRVESLREIRPTALVGGGGGRGVQATWTTVQETPSWCSPKALQVVPGVMGCGVIQPSRFSTEIHRISIHDVSVYSNERTVYEAE